MTCHRWVQTRLWRSACLKVNRAGFSGFELGNKFPRSPEVLGPILDNHGLNLVSGWFSGRLLTHSVEEEIVAIEDHLDLLQSLGATVMVYCEITDCIHGDQSKPLLHRPTMDEKTWVEFGRKLTELAEYTRSRGVEIAYHHHMGTVVQTEQDIDLLMLHTGEAVGLLLDTGHITYAGGTPSECRTEACRQNQPCSL